VRILLVEDDSMIGEAMERSLKDAGYAVDWVRDGSAAIAAVDSRAHGAVLLDLGLPGPDGHAVLTRIRSNEGELPVVIVSAREALEERLRGLDGGADDYVLKPFEMSELLARIRAVIRRSAGTPQPTLSNGTIGLDPATREATVHGLTQTLTAREFALLRALMVRPGAILSRRELEDRIYGWNEEVESNAVEFLIHSLRKKLGASTIRNVRGVGWMVARRS
jgi:two-component system OmpR family response regulator